MSRLLAKRETETDTEVTRTQVGAGLVLANTSPNASLTNLRVQWQQPTERPAATIQGLVFDLPGVGRIGPPTDPDDDGLYEDVTGDERVTVEDAVVLTALYVADQQRSFQFSPEQATASDFTGDGQFTEADVIALAYEITSQFASLFGFLSLSLQLLSR